MKEFIDKLIGRLEKEKKEAKMVACTLRNIVLDEAIEIVNQLAEEHNGGWIPCSERLPSEQGEYLTYVNYDGDCFRSIDEYLCEGLLAGWNCTPNYRVLAWQPLPPKYEPKGE